MYWGTGLSPALNSVGMTASTWHEVDIVDSHRGTITATDAETPTSGLTYKLQDDVRFGNLSLDPTTGVWSYVHTAADGKERRVRR